MAEHIEKAFLKQPKVFFKLQEIFQGEETWKGRESFLEARWIAQDLARLETQKMVDKTWHKLATYPLKLMMESEMEWSIRIERMRNELEDVIVDCGYSFLQRHEFSKLAPNMELETEIITMVSSLLTEDERLKNEKECKIWYLPVRILNDLLPYPNLPLHESWRKMHYYERFMGSLKHCNEIYIPLLILKHYLLARVMIKEKKVEVWDSLAHENSPILQSSKIVDILRNLDLGLENEFTSRPSTFNFASFRIVRAANVPRQPNDYDCGIFVILFMIHRCKFDGRSFAFDSNEERCYVATWLACSKYNKLRRHILQQVRDGI
ncbi:hypothetical protein G4B88_028547 [Cannabis sativa]|uniref:Ubiquitin-like protease family profile domain-containing protein n=1 Tax=Cannabis sativa TaxID=3483 RepID=A0A7J6DKW7_CANSA|nr:hypothetical protein G4B88_028547 [Cannabis sativa]